MKVVEYTTDRFDEVIALMRNTPGVSVRAADSRDATERYLIRNPGLNFLAIEGNEVIGRYWTKRGWTKREDINRYSLTLNGDENA